MEDYTKLVKKQLYKAFFDWLETNREQLQPKWFNQLWKEAEKSKNETLNLVGLMGVGMWMLAMLNEQGVIAGIARGKPNVQGLREGLDEKSSMRILNLIASLFCVQGLPMDVLEKQIAEINPKHFSLTAYIQERKQH